MATIDMSQLMQMLGTNDFPSAGVNNSLLLDSAASSRPTIEDSWSDCDPDCDPNCDPDCELERVRPPTGCVDRFQALGFGSESEQSQDCPQPEDHQVPTPMNEESVTIRYTLKTCGRMEGYYNPRLDSPGVKNTSYILTTTMDPVNFGPIAQPGDDNKIKETIAIIDEATELRQGCCKTFVDGKLHKSGFYVNDVKEGDFNYYGPRRLLKTTKTYEGGILKRMVLHTFNTTVEYQQGSNITTDFHPNGTVAHTFTHIVDSALLDDPNIHPSKDDLRGTLMHGVEERRDPDGNITHLINWYRGQKHGVSKSFKNGEPNGHETYNHGVLNGECISYHPNGVIDTNAYYVNGKLHGPFVAHYPNGNLKSYGTYADGHQRDITRYFEDGAIHSAIVTSEAGYTSRREFRPNGVLELSEQYLNNQLEGPRTIYHANGKPSIQSHYSAGKKHGPYEVFSEEGVRLEITAYYDDVPVGVRKLFYPDGSPKVVENYEGGRLHGLRETFGYGMLITSNMFNDGYLVKKA